METIPSRLAETVRLHRNKIALIEPDDSNTISQITYQELEEKIECFAGYLQQQGLQHGETIMIWSGSRINWLISYFGALLIGLVVVPVDVSTREDLLQRLIETTEARYLITTKKQYEALVQKTPTCIDIDHLPEHPLEREKLPALHDNDLAVLIFTSGTTGHPKGVMITHKNIVSNARAALEVVHITENDCALSILPLSHMLEMTIDIALITMGSSIVYARSLTPDTLFRLLATQKITCIILVPQALQLFMNGIEREVRKRKQEKMWALLHKIAGQLPFGLRKYVFWSIHKRFGVQFRFFVSGGAALPIQLGQQWQRMGFRIQQGYGTTECSPVVSVTRFNDHNLTSVGPPLPGIEVKIDIDGEVLVHGPNVASGYWKHPEATATAFQNGWYHTGDLGYLDKHNNLYLKGRKKNMIVLANGLNVYPEDIEEILQTQAGMKDAIVVGIEREDHHPTIHAVLLTERPEQAKAAIQAANKQLASHQQIKGYTIWPETDFPRTFTLKVKRHEVLEKLQEMNSKH